MPVKDSLIAATARQHRLTVATRNTHDYRHAGVTLVNPLIRSELGCEAAVALPCTDH